MQDVKIIENTYDTELIQIMEEQCKNFQKQLNLEKELEKILKTVDDTSEVLIEAGAYNEYEWDNEIEVKCIYTTKIASKLKELFPNRYVEERFDKCVVKFEGELD